MYPFIPDLALLLSHQEQAMFEHLLVEGFLPLRFVSADMLERAQWDSGRLIVARNTLLERKHSLPKLSQEHLQGVSVWGQKIRKVPSFGPFGS